MMAVELNPNGTPVEVGRLMISSPGLQGMAIHYASGASEMRSAEQTTDAFEQALRNMDVLAQETVEIFDTREVDFGGVRKRSTHFDEPALIVQVPDAGDDWGQVLMYTDESGVTTWNFPQDDNNQIDISRGTPTRTYVIRRYVAQSPAESVSRGVIGAIGKKVLKVLAFKLLEPIGSAAANYFVSRWENSKRPYRFRGFTPANYQQSDVDALDASDWEKLGSGRALLMIHGTNSRTHIAFHALPQSCVHEFHNAYEGRVFAFDHLTLSEDPAKNIAWFFSNLPDDIQLDVDIICHSRGGLVARLLSEQQERFLRGNRSLTIKKIVFVAVPNSGTILSDANYMGDFIDIYTNLLNFFPDNGVTESLEGIIGIAKQLAVGALGGLDGLQSMCPNGEFLTGLNTPVEGVTTHYYALTSNYEPLFPGFKAYATDRLMDKIFKVRNDLVVPTEGVYIANGASGFPIENNIIYTDQDGIPHTGFFGQDKVQNQIMSWLSESA